MGTPALSPTEALTRRVEAVESAVLHLGGRIEEVAALLRDVVDQSKKEVTR